MKYFATSVAILIVVFFLTGSSLTFADPTENLKSLLVDLEGWEAEEADGSSVDMGGVKVINVARSYSNGDYSLDVTILLGSNVMILGQTQELNAETEDGKVTTSDIDGFNVIQAFDKTEKDGSIVVTLEKKTAEGAMFIVSYEGISEEEALEIAKKFDWEKIKAVTGKMIK
ncbi:hypothetical protein JW935_13785 [candidate division KSB1 bacterium]|nr:hypothetical protein [candidate division KSB1 bacterium]